MLCFLNSKFRIFHKSSANLHVCSTSCLLSPKPAFWRSYEDSCSENFQKRCRISPDNLTQIHLHDFLMTSGIVLWDSLGLTGQAWQCKITPLLTRLKKFLKEFSRSLQDFSKTSLFFLYFSLFINSFFSWRLKAKETSPTCWVNIIQHVG